MYDRVSLMKKEIHKYVVISSAAPPVGGRSPLTPRFMRHNHVFSLPDPTDETVNIIFTTIVSEFMKQRGFSEDVRKLAPNGVTATIELYNSISARLLPIPAKFHYTFNMRDIAKVFQGIMMTAAKSILKGDTYTKLWMHECFRVFNDRLINEEDRVIFRDFIMDLLRSKFKVNWEAEDIFGENYVIFSMLLKVEADEKLYEEIIDKKKLNTTLEN